MGDVHESEVEPWKNATRLRGEHYVLNNGVPEILHVCERDDFKCHGFGDVSADAGC